MHTDREQLEYDISGRSANVRRGRIGTEVLKELIPPTLNCHFFVCGPGISVYERAAAREKGLVPDPRFLETAIAALKELGVPPNQITHESYGE